MQNFYIGLADLKMHPRKAAEVSDARSSSRAFSPNVPVLDRSLKRKQLQRSSAQLQLAQYLTLQHQNSLSTCHDLRYPPEFNLIPVHDLTTVIMSADALKAEGNKLFAAKDFAGAV